MGESTPRQPIADKRVVYRSDAVEGLAPRRETYRSAGGEELALDLYEPASAAVAGRPAAVIVGGYPGAGFRSRLGCEFREMAATVDWARLLAGSGIVGIAYANREPAADLEALLGHLARNAEALGIDRARIGLFATSGNGPVALWALRVAASFAVRCAALFYAYSLDLGGATGVAEASRMFGLANPGAGLAFGDLARRTPIFLARAGRDDCPGLNDALDRFTAAALAANAPLEVVNHPEGPHAFDLLDDTAVSRQIVRKALAFLRFNLAPEEGGS
jgi:hypothetical protein